MFRNLGSLSKIIKKRDITWVVMGVLLNMLAQGMLLSYSSVLLPAILSPESDIKVDLHVTSWVASIIGTAGTPGLLTSSILTELFGRKTAYAILMVPGILGWLCMYFANSVPVLLIGRALGGLTAAATLGLGAIVIGEYTSPKNRGMFLNLKTTTVCLGYMMVHCLAYSYSWRTIALIALVPVGLSMMIIITWPESPPYLASKKRFAECEKAFLWLRGKSDDALDELNKLIQAQKESCSFKTQKTSKFRKNVNFLKKFIQADFVKPFFIVVFSGVLLETCGRHVFPAFALQIVEEITGRKSNSFYYTLGIDIIITASLIFSSGVVKMFKRRTILFATGFAALFVLFSACLHLYLSAKEYITNRPIVSMSMFAVYFILSNLGCTPLPLVIFGEIFPLPHRSAGISVGGFMMSLCMMLVLHATPFLLLSIKVYGTFSVFGALMGLALTVLWFILPETKDKTLQEIEDHFYLKAQRSKDDEEIQMKMIVSDVA